MNHNGNAIESRLWAAADELRANSKLKSSEYSVPVLGLVFLRYADHKFQEAAKELAAAGSGGRRKIGPADYQARGVLYLPEAARFSTLIALPEGANIGASINEAMSAIEAENPDLKDVLPKSYNRFENALLKELLKTMNSVPMDIEGDAFGKIYEYFLGHFAMSEGQKGGEFFTPTAIVSLLVAIIQPFHGRICDMANGSGGMFVQSARFVEAHKRNPSAEISIYGQERVSETVRLCKMNLAVHGLAGDIRQGNIRSADGFARVGLLDDAVEALVASEEIKLRYLDLTNAVLRLYKAVLPDPLAQAFSADVMPLQVIADKIRALTPPADISQVMQQVEGLLDRSIAAEGYVIRELNAPFDTEHGIDLSKIDFEKLAEKFKRSRKRTLNEQLKGTVARKLMVLVRLNHARMDYLEQFQAMIDAYNAGSLNAEEFFRQLVVFAQSLNEEEKRAVGEQLSEEELALFDLLTKPQIEMSDADREKVKATARELLTTLKAGKLVLDWRKRQQARAEVRVTIEKLLDKGLPKVYTPELFEQKTAAVFQHVYDAYYGAGRSIYAAA